MLARRVLMVRPATFVSDPETRASNAFQASGALSREAVLGEFDGFVQALRREGIDVWVLDDTPEPPKPDAIFPNNWVTFFPGQAVVHSMLAAARRLERREEVLVGREVIDLSSGPVLEGTGSMVLDREAKTAFAALSARTTRGGLRLFSERMGYRVVAIETSPEVYHTNVLMTLGPQFAVLCREVIVDDAEVMAALEGREVIEITAEQMSQFCGNMLVLDGPILVLSEAAHRALSEDQVRRLERHAKLVPVAIPEIEKLGGSARCMLAEVF